MVRPYLRRCRPVHVLMEIDPRYPEVTADQRRQELEAKEELMTEGARDRTPPA